MLGMQNTKYPSDRTDTEWKILQPLLPPRRKRGRPPTERRRVLDAIR
jgi:transposase